MATSPNLEITHVAEAQTQKHATVNTAINQLEAAITAKVSVAMADANQTLADSVALRNMLFECTGSSMTTGRNVVVPINPKLYLFLDSESSGQTITVKTPSGSGIALPAGVWALLYCDGTNVIKIMFADGS